MVSPTCLFARPKSSSKSVNNNNNNWNEVIDWDDRLGVQAQFSLETKGWAVSVEWKTTPAFGVGLFALEAIDEGTVLRQGILGRNLVEFQSVADIDDFVGGDAARLHYVADYMWGFYRDADYSGYPKTTDDRFYGMWIPGNGLNHSPEPNSVYRTSPQGIDLIALTPIQAGDEIYDDYRRHGEAPAWLKQWGKDSDVMLNFADCNDFVEKE